MTLESLPPCVDLYQPHRREWLISMIESLGEELRAIPRHRHNARRVADIEKVIANYRDALSRIDAAEAEARPPTQ